jgi:hypothetical protein
LCHSSSPNPSLAREVGFQFKSNAFGYGIGAQLIDVCGRNRVEHIIEYVHLDRPFVPSPAIIATTARPASFPAPAFPANSAARRRRRC